MNAWPPIRAVAGLSLALFALPALAVDPANLSRITFENRTGGDIRYLCLSPGDSDYWGTDILVYDDEIMRYDVHAYSIVNGDID